ncbi:MAG TPA: hypothetical protein VF476_16205 [Chitinophagaceae bacterium]
MHKQKLYALIAAGVGLISVFLPWWRFSLGGFGGYSVNGLRDLGILTFIGFIGAAVVTLMMGDKTKPYAGQEKMIAAGCFAGAGLFALIQFLRQSNFTGFGLYLAILAGIGGAVLVWVIKPEQLEKK